MRAGHFLAVLASAFALVFASQATAASLTPRNPAGIVTALQAAGYQAELSKGDDGSPQIITGVGGGKIVISLSGCKAGINCDYIEIISLWTCTPEQTAKCDSIVDSWPKEEHMASMMKTGDSYAMYYYLVVEDGNFSDDMFISTLKYFAGEAAQWQSKL